MKPKRHPGKIKDGRSEYHERSLLFYSMFLFLKMEKSENMALFHAYGLHERASSVFRFAQ